MSNKAINVALNNISGIPSSAKFILVVLSNYANDDNVCWPSISTLSINCGLSESCIYRKLRYLESKGLITRELHSQRVSNTYHLDFMDYDEKEESVGNMIPEPKKLSTDLSTDLSTNVALSDPSPCATPPLAICDPNQYRTININHHRTTNGKESENSSVVLDSDFLISDVLTKSQESKIKDSLIQLKNQCDEYFTLPSFEEIAYTILDLNSFSMAGNDFAKKLNTIKKLIGLGKFRVPVGFIKKKQEEKEMDRKQQQRQINEARISLRDAVSSRDNIDSLINKTQEKMGPDQVVRLEESRKEYDDAIPGLINNLKNVLNHTGRVV